MVGKDLIPKIDDVEDTFGFLRRELIDEKEKCEKTAFNSQFPGFRHLSS